MWNCRSDYSLASKLNCPPQLPRPAYTCGANLLEGSMLVLPFVLSIAHDLVLDTLQILEEEGVVTWGGVFRILPCWTHYCGPYLPQLRMELFDLGARCRSECKML